MEWNQHSGLTYLQFPRLSRESGFFHGIFTYPARDAQGRLELFNLGLGCGMPDDLVRHNRRRMLSVFGNGCTGIYARQVHGLQVGIFKSRPTSTEAIRIDGDALVTVSTSCALVILTADCQSVIIIDPVKRVAANIHSGWRGSIGNIVGRAVESMTAEFDCRPSDMVCGIGPSLGPCCAEFINYRQEIPRSFWKYRRAGDMFDFWQISKDQLVAAGVEENKISTSYICSKCNQHLFFSYRGRLQTGRFASVVGIR